MKRLFITSLLAFSINSFADYVEHPDNGWEYGATGSSITSFEMTIYGIYVSKNADCSDMTLIKDYGSSPITIDLKNNPSFGSVSVDQGTYHCVAFDMKREFVAELDASADDDIPHTPACNYGAGNSNSFTIQEGSFMQVKESGQNLVTRIDVQGNSSKDYRLFNSSTWIEDAVKGDRNTLYLTTGFSNKCNSSDPNTCYHFVFYPPYAAAQDNHFEFYGTARTVKANDDFGIKLENPLVVGETNAAKFEIKFPADSYMVTVIDEPGECAIQGFTYNFEQTE